MRIQRRAVIRVFRVHGIEHRQPEAVFLPQSGIWLRLVNRALIRRQRPLIPRIHRHEPRARVQTRFRARITALTRQRKPRARVQTRFRTRIPALTHRRKPRVCIQIRFRARERTILGSAREAAFLIKPRHLGIGEEVHAVAAVHAVRQRDFHQPPRQSPPAHVLARGDRAQLKPAPFLAVQAKFHPVHGHIGQDAPVLFKRIRHIRAVRTKTASRPGFEIEAKGSLRKCAQRGARGGVLHIIANQPHGFSFFPSHSAHVSVYARTVPMSTHVP